MITLFTLPKPFVGHIGMIQRNAIQSWTRLHPDIDILMFGSSKAPRKSRPSSESVISRMWM